VIGSACSVWTAVRPGPHVAARRGIRVRADGSSGTPRPAHDRRWHAAPTSAFAILGSTTTTSLVPPAPDSGLPDACVASAALTYPERNISSSNFVVCWSLVVSRRHRPPLPALRTGSHRVEVTPAHFHLDRDRRNALHRRGGDVAGVAVFGFTAVWTGGLTDFHTRATSTHRPMTRTRGRTLL